MAEEGEPSRGVRPLLARNQHSGPLWDGRCIYIVFVGLSERVVLRMCIYMYGPFCFCGLMAFESGVGISTRGVTRAVELEGGEMITWSLISVFFLLLFLRRRAAEAR